MFKILIKCVLKQIEFTVTDAKIVINGSDRLKNVIHPVFRPVPSCRL